jgi:hypothetical protein
MGLRLSPFRFSSRFEHGLLPRPVSGRGYPGQRFKIMLSLGGYRALPGKRNE